MRVRPLVRGMSMATMCLPDLLAHRYFGDFALTQFQGFAKPHSLVLDLGEPYRGGPLWLLLHGEVEYFSANSMYAASQAGVQAISPYVEALGADGKWVRVVDDMGFPAGGPRTMTADLTGKLPPGTQKIRITTNLQIYWDNILMSRTPQESQSDRNARQLCALTPQFPYTPRRPRLPRLSAEDRRHSTGKRAIHLRKDERDWAIHASDGNLHSIRRCVAAADCAGRQAGSIRIRRRSSSGLRSVAAACAAQGWVRDYFFAANGYEKDMDFYAAEGNFVAPLPFLKMGDYPYPPGKSFPLDDAHVNYLLEYNTRHMSGNEQRGYWFDYGSSKSIRG